MSCCAMCQVSCNNDDSYEELNAMIQRTKKESKLEWNPNDRASGERAIIVITTPWENNLEANLKKLNFKVIKDDLKRRNGYPQVGNLKMWMLNW